MRSKDRYDRYDVENGYDHHGSFDEDDPLVDDSGGDVFARTVAKANLQVRLGFIRKVYGIVTLQLLLSLVAVGIGLFNDTVKAYVQTHENFLYAIMGVTFGLMLVMTCFSGLMRSFPINVILLFFFTAFMSILLMAVTSFYDTRIVYQALIVTAFISIGLTAYTFQSDRDFSQMGTYLFVFLMVLVIGGVIRIFLPTTPVLDTVWACFGALVFSAYIVFDTFLILNKLGPDDYVFAALNLYLDVINLFLYILQILGGRGRK
eukprot:TRINITY_DN54258_c0_g1_i2.p2 TRINITY_DN54258_c0_g1~~TRINITY_DN54258_c0_g1_i2.p2  ORF type:complete len:261 (+),score=130.39 TRINITY_DN54258_c0_g1_i2:13-795(+)